MKRYESVQIQKRYDGKRVYKTTRYPVINPSPSDIVVVSNEGDYLDTLAFKYFKDPTLWWIIANLNNIGKGRMSVTEGLNLRIPINVNEIIDRFNRLNK